MLRRERAPTRNRKGAYAVQRVRMEGPDVVELAERRTYYCGLYDALDGLKEWADSVPEDAREGTRFHVYELGRGSDAEPVLEVFWLSFMRQWVQRGEVLA